MGLMIPKIPSKFKILQFQFSVIRLLSRENICLIDEKTEIFRNDQTLLIQVFLLSAVTCSKTSESKDLQKLTPPFPISGVIGSEKKSDTIEIPHCLS